jgi:hypothetical protein
MIPTASETLAELLRAESECDQLIKEVEEYNWESGPYPLGLAFAYPEADIYFFQDRARDAHHIKTRILTALESLGPQAEGWKQQISKIDFYEVYIHNGLTPGAKRPCDSGLIAAREILRTVRATIGSGKRKTLPRSIGSPRAVAACQAYINAKGLTAAKFAKNCRTTDRTIRKFFKTGQVKKSVFQDIASSLGITTEQLSRGELADSEKHS